MASFDARVMITWGDGEHAFRLAFAQLIELQDNTDAGPLELFQRIGSGRWRVMDLRETIRLGLVGGGMVPAKAVALVQRYVEQRPLAESVPVALEILTAAIAIPEDSSPGKAEATEETGASPPPQSTDAPQSSASDPRPSTE